MTMTPGRIWATCLAILAVAFLGAWAWHHKLAAAVTIGGTLFIASLATSAALAARWIDSRKDAADRERRIEALEAALAEQTRAHADAGVPVELRSLPHDFEPPPNLTIVPPIPVQRSDSWLENVIDEQAWLNGDGA